MKQIVKKIKCHSLEEMPIQLKETQDDKLVVQFEEIPDERESQFPMANNSFIVYSASR